MEGLVFSRQEWHCRHGDVILHGITLILVYEKKEKLCLFLSVCSPAWRMICAHNPSWALLTAALLFIYGSY